jgi:DNA-binding transcriptional MerR regulator
MNNFQKHPQTPDITKFRLPRYNELPDIGLYMDQVISVIDSSLSLLLSSEDEKIITSTMINNYVKQKLVSPPKNKKYSRNHLAYLIVVCAFKTIFSISEICELIRIQIESYTVEEAYNYFCSELELSLKACFTTREFMLSSTQHGPTMQSEILRSAVIALTNKVYIDKYLQYMKLASEMEEE